MDKGEDYYKVDWRNQKIQKSCGGLIGQAAAWLKSGSGLIGQVAALSKLGSCLIVQAAALSKSGSFLLHLGGGVLKRVNLINYFLQADSISFKGI